MSDHIDASEQLEASDEQLSTLRELGVNEPDLVDLSFADAVEWIAELQAVREDAGRVGRD